jgi:hypothetical protein
MFTERHWRAIFESIPHMNDSGLVSVVKRGNTVHVRYKDGQTYLWRVRDEGSLDVINPHATTK